MFLIFFFTFLFQSKKNYRFLLYSFNCFCVFFRLNAFHNFIIITWAFAELYFKIWTIVSLESSTWASLREYAEFESIVFKRSRFVSISHSSLMETGIPRLPWTSGEFFTFVINTIDVILVQFLIAYLINDSVRVECAWLPMVLKFLVV